MVQNSFMLKGWAITLIVGIFTLLAKDVDERYALVLFFPIVFFWGLDSYYLLQERLYRSLYQKVAQLTEDEIDFSLSAKQKEFSNKKNCFWRCFFSKTELIFYFSLTMVCTVIIITNVKVGQLV